MWVTAPLDRPNESLHEDKRQRLLHLVARHVLWSWACRAVSARVSEVISAAGHLGDRLPIAAIRHKQACNVLDPPIQGHPLILMLILTEKQDETFTENAYLIFVTDAKDTVSVLLLLLGVKLGFKF